MSFLAIAAMSPLLVKISFSGFGPAEWARSEKCEVFDNKIVMTRTYNQEEIKFEYPFDGQETLQHLIANAANEKISLEDNYMCDGPSTSMHFTYPTVGLGKELLLYSTGGCGSPKKQRLGPASQALIDIASTFCPTTH
jgi:hypothetical protein